jgi:elongation factor P
LISTTQFKNGLAIEVNGEIFIILEFQHVKPGKGQAFVRTKLKNLKTGATISKNFRAGEEVEEAYLDRREMEYLYNDGDNFYFMDSQNYEQVSLSKGEVKDAIKFLKENTKVVILFHEGKPVLLEFPIFVELKVVRTEPGVKGNTVSGGTKPAELETGAIIQVPLFIKEGDIVRVDTRTSKYVTRV